MPQLHLLYLLGGRHAPRFKRFLSLLTSRISLFGTPKAAFCLASKISGKILAPPEARSTFSYEYMRENSGSSARRNRCDQYDETCYTSCTKTRKKKTKAPRKPHDTCRPNTWMRHGTQCKKRLRTIIRNNNQNTQDGR